MLHLDDAIYIDQILDWMKKSNMTQVSSSEINQKLFPALTETECQRLLKLLHDLLRNNYDRTSVNGVSMSGRRYTLMLSDAIITTLLKRGGFASSVQQQEAQKTQASLDEEQQRLERQLNIKQAKENIKAQQFNTRMAWFNAILAIINIIILLISTFAKGE